MRLSDVLLKVYVALVVLAAAAMIMEQPEWRVPPQALEFWNVVGALVAVALLAEGFSLRTRIGTVTTAVSFVPYLASILLVGPAWAIAVAGFSEFLAETVFRRKPFVKVIHNTSKEIVGIGVAAYAYQALGGHWSLITFTPGVPAFGAAVVLYFVITNGATATAQSLSSGGGFVENWRQMVAKPFVYNSFSASLSVLLAFLYIELNLAGFLLVIIPLFFLRHAEAVNLQLEYTNRDLLELMVKSIEARDPYTSGHSLRVSRIAKMLARHAGVPPKEMDQIETAALLHDVGKIYEEYAPILRKEGRLAAEEQELMQTHPIKSAELVATISSLRGYIVSCIRHHHENWDGGGYPDGLMGDEIPLGARIIMMADTTDAMTTDRPYRSALSYDRLVEELVKYSGKQFDPTLVDLFRKSAAIKRLVDQRQAPTEPERPAASVSVAHIGASRTLATRRRLPQRSRDLTTEVR